MFSVGDKVRILTGPFKGDTGVIIDFDSKEDFFSVQIDGVFKPKICYLKENIELIEASSVIDKAVYLTGQVTFNGELVNCAVEFGGDANLGNVIVVHLPKNKDISNATKCIYFKYDLEV